MDDLSQSPSYQSERAVARGEVAWEIRELKGEQRTKQVLTIIHDDELVTYQIDDPNDPRPEGERMPDGVVLAQVGDRSIVCFVELKTTMKPKEGEEEDDRAVRGLSQVDSAVDHFHPFGRSGKPRSHGDDHHDAWRDGNDDIEFLPGRAHEVVAIAATFRSPPRRPPEPPRQVGTKKVIRAVVHVHPATNNKAELTLKRLLALAGVR